MTRRNWLKALTGGVAALCGVKATKVAAAKRPAPAPPRMTTCVVTLPPGARVYTTEAP